MARLQEQACELEKLARREDITVWEDCIVKQTKKGEKKYGRWLAKNGQSPQGLPEKQQKAEPGRGHEKGPADEGGIVRDGMRLE